MLELAEKNDFTIIGFTEEVRFIDITKDLHELLLGFHENTWWELENLQKELNNELLSNGNIGDFLRVLHKVTEGQVALKYDDQYRFFPSPPKRKQHHWITKLEQNHNYAEQSINLFGSSIASLYLIRPQNNITQFEELALKRCSEILGQFFWKNHQEKEDQLMKKNEWIFEAIAGSLNHENIVAKIHQETPGILMKEAIIGVKPFYRSLLSQDKENISETALILLLRPILLEYGFQLLTVRDYTRNIYIFLLINQQSNNLFERLEQALQQVYRSEEHTSELQSRGHLVCRLLLEKKNNTANHP